MDYPKLPCHRLRWRCRRRRSHLVVMEGELQAMLGRAVDLVERSAIEQAENYIRRKAILSHTEIIYAA